MRIINMKILDQSRPKGTSLWLYTRLCVPFPLEEIKYLIFSFARSGKKAKLGVVFYMEGS